MRGYLVILVAVVTIACGDGAAPTAPSPLTPATAGDLKSSLSTAFDALAIPGNAACSISISQHGQVVLERGRGDVAPGRAADGESLYRIASLPSQLPRAPYSSASRRAGLAAMTRSPNILYTQSRPQPSTNW